MAIYTLGDRRPTLGRDALIAPNATVIGDVHLGEDARIRWNAVLPEDKDRISNDDGSGYRPPGT